MVLSNAQWFNKTGAYTIDQSCRFDSDTPAYLARTFGTPTSDKIWTLSFWAKICRRDSGNLSIFMGAGDWDTDYTAFYVTPDLKWDDRDHSGSAWKTQFRTNAVYRDPSAWYHIVWSYDSTPSTPSASSIKMFVNGEQLTSFSSETYPSQNTASVLNTAVANWIGGIPTNGATYYFDGYMAEVVFVDGTALDADSFGETNSTTGQWIPKSPSGITFGNNGFHLDFADSSALGNDVSGNDNDFTPSGLAAADQVSDSPTNNHPTLSPLTESTKGPTIYTLSDGNLVAAAGPDRRSYGNIAFDIEDADGFYFEAKVTTAATYPNVGIRSVEGANEDDGSATNVGRYNFIGSSGNFSQPSGTGSYGDAWAGTADKVIGVLAKAGSLYFSIDGTVQNSGTAAVTGLTGYFLPLIFYDAASGTQAAWAMQFAANMWSTTPTGYKAICTANFDEPTIDDPGDYFNPILYEGTGANQSITGAGFQPDWVWIKNREDVVSHYEFDALRGAGEYLRPNLTSAEDTASDSLTSFDSDGFSLGSDSGGTVNNDDKDFVSWNWKEGSTPGFDIVLDTGTGSAHTISHSLGVTPEFIIRKDRTATADPGWIIWHTSLPGANYYLNFDTGAQDTSVNYWNNTLPTSSVFSVGASNGTNQDTKTFVTYLFAGVEGFSKFGSYESNNNADGPFIWCGFKPAYLLLKCVDAVTNWEVRDNARSPYNVASARLLPNSSSEEDSSLTVDFLSNGFKLVAANAAINPSTATVVFAAFASTPFKTATAR